MAIRILKFAQTIFFILIVLMVIVLTVRQVKIADAVSDIKESEREGREHALLHARLDALENLVVLVGLALLLYITWPDVYCWWSLCCL